MRRTHPVIGIDSKVCLRTVMLVNLPTKIRKSYQETPFDKRIVMTNLLNDIYINR